MQRMNLRNNSLQKWRDIVYTADTKPSPNRMSMPYPRPNREPPYWLSLPCNLQARTCQLMSGCAVTQKFLSVIDKENFEPLCPLNDGPGHLTHYLYSCRVTEDWRDHLTADTNRDLPTPQEFVTKDVAYLLQLVDHSAIGSHSFEHEKGRSLHHPEEKFWTPLGIPLSGKDNMRDITRYSGPPHPKKLAEVSGEACSKSFIHPDMDFGSDQSLPPLRWFERTRALPPARTLIVTCRNQGRHLSPPGRPPDPPDQSDPDSPILRSSSPDLLLFSDL